MEMKLAYVVIDQDGQYVFGWGYLSSISKKYAGIHPASFERTLKNLGINVKYVNYL